jgi:glycosyltransferase involved in cell wall biosynthesis
MKYSIKTGGSDTKVLAIVTVDIMAWVLLCPWLKGLQDAGFEVHIACAKGQYYDRLGGLGFVMHPVSFRRTFNVFAHVIPFFELVGILRAGRFQIVNTHSPVAAAVGRMAAAFASVENIVYTVHGFYFHDRMPPLLANPIIALEWLLGRWTDAFMFVSDEDRRTAQRLGICGVNARVCTIYNGVDVDLYRPAADSDAVTDALRIQHGLQNRPVVGMVGRIVKEKGYREFLEMARGITESGIDATYLVVGDSLPSDRDQFGPTFRASVKEAGLADRFVLTGMTDRVSDYLRLMDVFVLPSYREGFPRSILEAMATSLPVVATDIRGCREAVVHGVTGYIVPPRDAAALRKAVEPLLTNPKLRKEMGREARRIAGERYDFNEVRRQFVGFVEAVHDGGPGVKVGGAQTPPALKLALRRSNVSVLLFLLLAVYFIPSLLASTIVPHFRYPFVFCLAGDSVGCVILGFLMGWRTAGLVYLWATAIELTSLATGLWTVQEMIWFSNLLPTVIIVARVGPFLVQARNWRRPRRRG